MPADPNVLLALIAELYGNLAKAVARITELETQLAAATGQPDPA